MDKKQKKINFSILLTISIISGALGISLIIQACRIFFRGQDRPYSQEIVVNYLLQIFEIIILWVIIIIAGGIYLTIKNHKNKDSVKPNFSTKLKNLIRIMPVNDEVKQTEEYSKLSLEILKQRIGLGINCAILTLSIIMSSCYVFNVNNFIYDSSNVHVFNEQIIDMVIHVIPWIVISLISSIILAIFNEFSSKRAIDYCKVIISKNGKKVSSVYKKSKKQAYILYAIQATIVVFAITLIIVGVIQGDASSVLNKAINICTECIGLG